MDILIYQLAKKALKKAGLIGSKKVDESGLVDGAVLTYSEVSDKYVLRELPEPPQQIDKVEVWVEGKFYSLSEIFVDSENKLYRTLIPHVSTSIATDLVSGKIVVLTSGASPSTGSGGFGAVVQELSVNRPQKIIANTNYQLSPELEYLIGANQLFIQLKNNPLIRNIDWFEVDSRHISFAYDIEADWEIVFVKYVFAENEPEQGLVGTKQVDEANIADEAVLKYDAATGRVVYGEAKAGVEVFQIVKLERQANDESIIPFENDSRIVIDAFKLIPGEQGVVKILKDFDNSEAENFIYDEAKVEFDGVMKLKTLTETKDMVFIKEEGDGAIYEVELDFSDVGKLLSLEVVEKSV